MLIDPHIHTTRYSACSHLKPDDLVKQALKLGLDGIVLTEHDVVWSSHEVEALRERAKADSLRIFRGQEVTAFLPDGSTHGHILAYGFYESLLDYRPSSQEAIRIIQEAGGVAVAAHPYRRGLGHADDVYHLPFDGIEVLTPNHLSLEAQMAEAARRLKGVGGLGASDSHDSRRIGYYLTELGQAVATEEEWVEEVRAGRCRPVAYTEAFADSAVYR